MAAGGFSLIEVAVAVAIVAVLATAMVGSLRAQVLNRQFGQAERQLAAARIALVGFAVAHGARLPCPDADGDGRADPGSSDEGSAPCRAPEGALPWRTLGVEAHDPWGHTLRYRPDSGFSAQAGIASDVRTVDAIEVVSTTTARPLTLSDPHAPAAILYSCGPNGTADAENSAGSVSVPCHTPRDSGRFAHGPPGRQFDDILIWVSKNVLIGWLVMAGAWPV